MFINNKKLWLGLTVATIASAVFFGPTINKPFAKVQLVKLSEEMNQSLPLVIDNNTSLIKVSVTTKKDINSLDFYYLKHTESSPRLIEDLKLVSYKLIKQACINSPTKDVLEHNILVRYIYVTADKKLLPILAILPSDCLKFNK